MAVNAAVAAVEAEMPTPRRVLLCILTYLIKSKRNEKGKEEEKKKVSCSI